MQAVSELLHVVLFDSCNNRDMIAPGSILSCLMKFVRFENGRDHLDRDFLVGRGRSIPPTRLQAPSNIQALHRSATTVLLLG